jgi:hypothetical protein
VKHGNYPALIFIAILTSIAPAQTNAPVNPYAPVMVLPQSDLEFNQWKEHDFLAFNPHYKEELTSRLARVHALGKQVISREIAGQNTGLSHQILSEIIWLISSTADFKRMDQRLDDLQLSLDHPEREAQAEQLDPTDGSWGRGYTEWFFKVIALYSQLDDTKSQFRFIDRINSPKKLTNYLTSVSVSDIPRTGVDHEREFNESLSNLMRMILRHKPKQYAYAPKLKATLMDLILHRFRNPKTGYWGESYTRNGRVYFVDDLSMTFHVVSYLEGNVPDMDKVVATTLAAQDAEFPVGCLFQGEHYDHLNMDVAELFRLGWPHASETQKKAIKAELHKLLQWCLTESLQPDGSFKMWIGDNSKEESVYYGASFLVRVGYFDKSKRFWTAEDFPEAEDVRQKITSYIEKHLKSGAAGGAYYQSALEQLGCKRARSI